MAQSNRTWIIAAVAVSIAIILAGWFLAISPKFSAASTAASETAKLDKANSLAQVELARLKAQDAALPDLQKQLDALQLSVPERALLEEYTVELLNLAAANGVSLSAINYSAGVALAPTATSTAAPADITPEDFVTINYSASLSGPRDNLKAFLGAVQLGTRLTVIPTLTLAQGPDAATWGLTMTGTIFVLLGPDGTQEGVPEVQPTATPTPTPAPTGTSTPSPTDTPSPTPTP